MTPHRRNPLPQSQPPASVKINTFWVAAIAILFIAFFFRFYRLADFPLGLYFDPAINGLDAVRLMQRGGLTPFFPTNGGRESLAIYLLVPFLWLFNTTPFAYRLAAAIISLLTVPLLFAFVNNASLWPDWPASRLKIESDASRFTSPASRFILAALASLTLATSYWHISVSRLFVRNILAPMLAIPIFWFYLKGWHNGQRRWFVMSGLLLGVAAYTYSVTRLLPLILVIALLPEFYLLARRKESRLLNQQLINLLLTALMALLVYLPMAFYLIAHPGQLTARSGSVMLWHFQDTPWQMAVAMGQNVWRVATFFCCQGSPNLLFGLPDTPGSALILAPFLLVGFIIAVKKWHNLFFRLIIVWWLVGLVPTIIAIEAPHPLRMMLAIPPTAILIGLGLFQLAKFLARFLTGRLATSLAFLMLLIPLPALFQAYFITWPGQTDVAGAYDYRAVAIRDAVLSQSKADIPIYLPLKRFNDSPLLFYLSGYFEREAKVSVSAAEKAMAIAPFDQFAEATWVRLYRGKATILPSLTIEGQQLLQTALAAGTTQTITTPVNGDPAARLAQIPSDPAQFIDQPSQLVDAAFGPIHLIGASYPSTITAPVDIPVTLYWQTDAVIRDELEILLRLVNDQRQVIGNGDGRPTDWVYPSTFWQPGLDTVAAQQTIALNRTQLDPGRYWLEVAVFDPAASQRLPLTSGDSRAPDTFFLGPLKVPLPPPPADALAALVPQPATFGDTIRLPGASLTPETISPGASLIIDLAWEAIAQPPLDYTVFVHLLDADGNLVAGHDSQPLAGRYPTSLWSDGERLLDQHSLTLPADIPPGTYRVAIGLYHQPTEQRLPLQGPNGQELPEGRLILTTQVEITASP